MFRKNFGLRQKRNAMITQRVHFFSSTAQSRIPTPETSPHLSPAISDWDADDEANMSADDLVFSRPISIVGSSGEGPMSPSRLTLDDILNERSQPPYTLSAFTAYLSQQHCLETLEFTMAAKQYRDKYAKTVARRAGLPMDYDHENVYNLLQDWIRILDVYIKPGSPREINLPAEERDELLEQIYSEKPPGPEALDPAVKRMYDLMGDSIFMPFLNSFNPAPQAKTVGAAPSDFGGRKEGRLDVSTSLLGECGDTLHRKPSRRRQSPSASSSIEFDAPKTLPAATSYRQPQPSGITSALSRTSGTRPPTHVSNSSAPSGQEGGLTDDSSADSPGGADLMTPPTTPPGSDLRMGSLHAHNSPKPNRSDSGGRWKMGKMFWAKKKNGGPSSRERLDEE